jgi:predicted acetyltransferase
LKTGGRNSLDPGGAGAKLGIFRKGGHQTLDENVKNIFKPFFTKKSKGADLGLSIVKKMWAPRAGKFFLIQTREKGLHLLQISHY